jgi:hypothetical protein
MKNIDHRKPQALGMTRKYDPPLHQAIPYLPLLRLNTAPHLQHKVAEARQQHQPKGSDWLHQAHGGSTTGLPPSSPSVHTISMC